MPAFLFFSFHGIAAVLKIYCGPVMFASPGPALRRGCPSTRRNGTVGGPFSPQMTEQNGKSWLEELGCRVSDWVADVAGHPFAQVGFILVCLAWFVVGWNVNILTAALSILAITLTQMVLSSQKERGIDARRRDVAMHAKLDELIAASIKARNDFVAVEERDEEEIVELKEGVKEAIADPPVGE